MNPYDPTLAGLEEYLKDFAADDMSITAVKAIKKLELFKEGGFKTFEKWAKANWERFGLVHVQRLIVLRRLEAKLVDNAGATPASLQLLRTINTENLFLEAGCKSFQEYCAKHEKRFGMKRIFKTLHHEERSSDVSQPTGVPMKKRQPAVPTTKSESNAQLGAPASKKIRYVLHNLIPPDLRHQGQVLAEQSGLPPVPVPTDNIAAGVKYVIKQDMQERPWEWDEDTVLEVSTDVSGLCQSEDVARDYLAHAKKRARLNAEHSRARHLYRYKLGLVLKNVPEQRGGDRVSEQARAGDQSSKFATLLPGERVIYDEYDKHERKRLRALALIPLSIYVAKLNLALGQNKALPDSALNNLAAKFKGKHRNRIIHNKAEEARREIKAAAAEGRYRDWVNFHCCRFQELHTKTNIPPLDLILTDPPWDREGVEANTFYELGKFADAHLKPNAPLVMMVGHCFLPQIIEQVQKAGWWLRWVMSVYYQGENHLGAPHYVNSCWKPVLVWQRKTEMEAKAEFRPLDGRDVIDAGRKLRDEDYLHDWHQEPQTFARLLRKFAEPNWVVADLCAGWATTAIACMTYMDKDGNHAPMRFIGCEMLPDRYQEGDDLAVLQWQVIHGGRAKAGSRPKELPLSVQPKAKQSGTQTAPVTGPEAKHGNLPVKTSKSTGEPKKSGNMYDDAKTWSPFQGCEFDCAYCEPSFKRTDKRQKQNCMSCYDYKPHPHPERLKVGEIPNSKIVFVCGHSDIAFIPQDYMRKIIDVIAERSALHPEQIFYLQSKKPSSLTQYLPLLPKSCIAVTTLETNRDAGYKEICPHAPVPSERFKQFLELDTARKVVTIEPVFDFDVEDFADMILQIKPEYVWLGYDSKPNFKRRVRHLEPSAEKMQAFVEILVKHGVEIRGKDLRGLELAGVKPKQA